LEDVMGAGVGAVGVFVWWLMKMLLREDVRDN